jgi:Zn finger protein HypA/HybF involved in hydrogenase expression
MRYEDFKIDFPCPQCESKFEVSLHQLFPGEAPVCPVCGATESRREEYDELELKEINLGWKMLERQLFHLREQLNNKDHD